MKRIAYALAMCLAVLALACEKGTVDPMLDPNFASVNGQYLKDTDANAPVPSDTTVTIGDVINLALAAGNGKGPQNNGNIVWTTSNAAVVSLVPNKGTAVATALSVGTATVTAKLGGNSYSVVIHVTAGTPTHYTVTSSSYSPVVGNAVTITAQLRDAGNNPVLEAGRLVTWSSTNGGSFAPITSTTDANGVATTSFTVSTPAGTAHVVTATDNFAITGSSAPIITQAGAASQMAAHAGQGQSAPVGTAVAVDPAVKVTDVYGNPIAGVSVTFTVTSGGGSVTGANATTDAGGIATVGSWTLGNTAGSNTLDATSPGLPTVTFTATGTTGAATQMVMFAGDNQSATVGTSVAIPPSVKVTDQYGNPVQGVAVNFAVTSGGGSVTGANATTDVNGIATAGSWTLGTTAGTNTLDATSASLPTVNFTATGTSGAATQLVMVTQPSATAQAGVQFAQQPSVRLHDAYGNDVAQSGVAVTASIASGGGTLLGTVSAVTDGAGVATYTDLAIGGTVGARTLDFSASGVSSANSNSIQVDAGPAANVNVTAPSNTVAPGSTVTITAAVTDAYANSVGAGTTVNWSSTNGGSFNPVSGVTDVNGEASTDFTAANSPSVSHVVTATAGAASGQITITTQDNAPVAGDDAFDAIGNVTVPVAAPGVLANDTDAETSVSAVAGSITTLNGGTVQMNADGSFTYLSAAGFSGMDSFDYTITDGSQTDIGTVTMTVTGPVWYVDNSATPPGDGRDVSPFTQLSSAESASGAGQTIFVLAGNGTSAGYNQGIVLKNGQSLIGQGVPANITVLLNGSTVTLLAANGTPQLTRTTAGPTIQLAQNDTVRGLAITSSSGAGITGTAFGSLTASQLSVVATGGAALDLDNGSVNAMFSTLASAVSSAQGLRLNNLTGTLSNTGGLINLPLGTGVEITGGSATLSIASGVSTSGPRVAAITSLTGGSVSLTGNLSGAGMGVLVQGNTGGSITFAGAVALNTGANVAVALLNNTGASIAYTGQLSIQTTTGNGFYATGGGTVTVTGTANMISTGNSTGLNVVSTTIGAAGLTFRSITSSGTNGIFLDNTGALGGLTVTGNGGPCNRSTLTCTGGAIASPAGLDGTTGGTSVFLRNTMNVSLNRMRFTGATNYGIRGINVTGFRADTIVMNGSFGTNAVLEEGAIVFDSLAGTSSISGSYIAGGVSDNVRVRNPSGVGTLTFTTDTIGLNNTLTGRDGIALSASGGTLNATVNGGRFFGARASMFTMRATGTATAALTFTNNEANNAHTNKIAGAAGVALSAGGAVLDNVNVTYTITGNTVTGSRGVGMAVTKSLGNAAIDGVITGNTIGNAGVANSGSEFAAGLFVGHATKGTHRVRVDGNNIYQYSGAGGIYVQAGGVSAAADPGVTHDGALHATIVNNTLSNPGTNNPGSFVDALYIEPGTNSGDLYTVCMNVGQAGSNNLANGGRPAEGGGAFSVIANAIGSNAKLKLAGYPLATHVGSAAEGPIVATLQALNATGGTGYAETPNLTTTYSGNGALGTACNLP